MAEPVPLSEIDFVPAPPPALTFNEALLAPAEVGLKVTLIVQLPPTLIGDEQVVRVN